MSRFEEWLRSAGLDIEVLYTEGGASTLTPLLAGSIDIAMSNGILGVIGAYAKGSDPRVDEAIYYWPAIQKFLQQDGNESIPFPNSVEALKSLLGPQPTREVNK